MSVDFRETVRGRKENPGDGGSGEARTTSASPRRLFNPRDREMGFRTPPLTGFASFKPSSLWRQ